MSCEKPVLRVSALSKRYEIFASPGDRLKQILLPKVASLLLRKPEGKFFREFWALRDLSFQVNKGETLGIIGRNGAGKSTLLQILCGTLTPSSGNVEITGRIAALLELGAGFNPDFTGRENVYLNGSLLGLSQLEVSKRFPAIEAFAEIGDFIDQPVKTYSSGMLVRLAFAVMIHVDADILIVDEALAVGDIYFAQKCLRFFDDFKKKGTLLLVSHDMATVRTLCDTALWIHEGALLAQGSVSTVSKKYLEFFYAGQGGSPLTVNDSRSPIKPKTADKTTYRSSDDWFEQTSILVSAFNLQSPNFGEGGAAIFHAAFVDDKGTILSEIIGGDSVCFKIVAKTFREIAHPALGFIVKNRHGKIVYDLSTYYPFEQQHLAFPSNTLVSAKFYYIMPLLAKGEYLISVAFADGGASNHIQLHWIHDCLKLSVVSGPFLQGDFGVSDPRVEVSLERVTADRAD